MPLSPFLARGPRRVLVRARAQAHRLPPDAEMEDDMFQKAIEAATVDFGTVGESCDFTVLASAFNDPFLGMDFLSNSEAVVLESDPEADLLAIAASIVVEPSNEIEIGVEVIHAPMDDDTELITEEEVIVANMMEQPESVNTPPPMVISESEAPVPPKFTPGSVPKSSAEITRIELMSSAESKALGLEFPMHRLPLSFFNERTIKRFPLNLAHKYKMQQMAGDTWLPDINFGQPTREPTRKRKTEPASSTVTSSSIGTRNRPSETVTTSTPPSAMPPPPPPMSSSAARRALCTFHCPRCKNVYKHRGTLKRHLISKHNILEDVPELDPKE